MGALLYRLLLLLLLSRDLFDWSYFALFCLLSLLLFLDPFLLFASLLFLILSFLLLLKLPLVFFLAPDMTKLDLHFFFDLLGFYQFLMDDKLVLVLLLDLVFLIVMMITFLLILLLIAMIYADNFSLLSMSLVRRLLLRCWRDSAGRVVRRICGAVLRLPAVLFRYQPSDYIIIVSGEGHR